MKKYFKNQLGQTLLEMIFAMGILMMVVAAVLALSAASIAGEKESESQVTANNLAREGIEVVRNIRDTNWLLKVDWDMGMKPEPSLLKCQPVFNSGSGTWLVSFPTSQIDSNFLVYLSTTGIYNYDTTGTPTGFYRYLLLNYICQKSDGSEYAKTDSTNCLNNETKIGLKVQSNVSWQESGKARSVNIEDYLYAWK